MSTVDCVFLIYMTLVVVRAVVVYKCNRKAINVAFDSKDWRTANAKREANDKPFLQILDLRKWTYRQFYPNLPEKS